MRYPLLLTWSDILNAKLMVLRAKLTFIFISSIYFLCMSQDVPKKANLIIFTADTLSGIELFTSCVSLLKNIGYSFEDVDKDFYLCTTKPIQPKGANFEYKIDLNITDNKVRMRSLVKLLTNFSTEIGDITYNMNQGWERGANRGLNTSIWSYGWKKQMELYEVIKKNITGKGSMIIEDSN